MINKKMSLCFLLICLSTGSVFVASGAISDGLLGHWKLDEGSGIVVNDTGAGGNVGTLIDGPTWTLGWLNDALDFDGINDYVDVPTFSLTSDTASFTAWVNMHSVDWWRVLINTYTANAKCGLVFYRNTATLGYYWNSEMYSWDSGLVVPMNEWVFVAAVVEPTKTTLYIKPFSGDLQSNVNIATHVNCVMNGVVFGKDSAPFWGDEQRKFDGLVDDIRIYERALSLCEIEELASANPCLNDPPVVSVVDDKMASVGCAKLLSCTVEDDGKPYQEGCDPLNPAGTPYVYTYLWQQLSGPGSVVFDDARVAMPNATFPQRGWYEIRVQVWDGPDDTSPEQYGKMGETTFNIFVKDPAIDDVLLGDWRFEESAGVDINDIAGANDAAVFGTMDVNLPVWTVGVEANGAIEFLGSDGSFVQVTNMTTTDPNLASLKSGSIAAWFQCDALAADAGSVTQFSIKTLTDSDISWITLEGVTDVNDMFWHHMAVTYDAVTGQMYLYIDGKEDAMRTVPPTKLIPPWHDTFIGSGSEAFEQSWSGAIDDVQIFNYALTADQVRGLIACREFINADIRLAADVSGPFAEPDCSVDFHDLSQIATHWMETVSPGDIADITGPDQMPDAVIDIYDLKALAQDWLSCLDPQNLNCPL